MKVVKRAAGPRKCYYCTEVTDRRIQGYPLGGRSCCHSCFAPIKQQHEEEQRQEANREPSEAESRIDYLLSRF